VEAPELALGPGQAQGQVGDRVQDRAGVQAQGQVGDRVQDRAGVQAQDRVGDRVPAQADGQVLAQAQGLERAPVADLALDRARG